MRSNGAIAKIVFNEFDPLFEGQTFETLISLQLELAQKCMGQLLQIFVFAIVILPSNSNIARTVLLDLYLLF